MKTHGLHLNRGATPQISLTVGETPESTRERSDREQLGGITEQVPRSQPPLSGQKQLEGSKQTRLR